MAHTAAQGRPMSRLRELVQIQTGVSFRKKLPKDASGNVRVIQQGDIRAGRIAADLERMEHPKLERDRLQAGDVLLRSKGSPLVAAEFREKPDVLPTITSASVLILRPQVRHLLPRYLVWLLNSTWGQGMLATIKSGTHIPVIAVRDLKEVRLPLPSLTEQARLCDLAELAQQHEELASRYREKIDSLLVAKSFGTSFSTSEERLT